MALSQTLVFKVKRSEPTMVRAAENELRPSGHEIKQLSDIDSQEILRMIVPGIIFYPPSVGESNKLDPFKTIREAVAQTLVFYYPLAGRIIEGPNGKLMVDCNNKGVVFVKADVNVKMKQLGDAILPPCPYMDDLLPEEFGWKNKIIGSPLLLFQVTRFICGGFSLGFVFNHTLVDGGGILLLVRTIGELVKGASMPSIRPVWQRELLDTTSLPKKMQTNPKSITSATKHLKYSENAFIRTSVFFTPRDIQALRDQLPTPQSTSLTKFDLITACLWKCRTMALEPNPSDIVRITIAMDARHRTGIELPVGYYGNATVYPTAISEAGILCESPLVYALDLVRRAKAEMACEYKGSVVDLMMAEGPVKHDGRWNFFVSDITKCRFDEFDLGWGKPLHGGVPWATSVLSWYNSYKNDKGEKGVVVTISLPSLAVEKFEHELNKLTCGTN